MNSMLICQKELSSPTFLFGICVSFPVDELSDRLSYCTAFDSARRKGGGTYGDGEFYSPAFLPSIAPLSRGAFAVTYGYYLT